MGWRRRWRHGTRPSRIARGIREAHHGGVFFSFVTFPFMSCVFTTLTLQLTHIDLSADNARECTLEIIKKKLKVWQGGWLSCLRLLAVPTMTPAPMPAATNLRAISDRERWKHTKKRFPFTLFSFSSSIKSVLSTNNSSSCRRRKEISSGLCTRPLPFPASPLWTLLAAPWLPPSQRPAGDLL